MFLGGVRIADARRAGLAGRRDFQQVIGGVFEVVRIEGDFRTAQARGLAVTRLVEQALESGRGVRGPPQGEQRLRLAEARRSLEPRRVGFGFRRAVVGRQSLRPTVQGGVDLAEPEACVCRDSGRRRVLVRQRRQRRRRITHLDQRPGERHSGLTVEVARRRGGQERAELVDRHLRQALVQGAHRGGVECGSGRRLRPGSGRRKQGRANDRRQPPPNAPAWPNVQLAAHHGLQLRRQVAAGVAAGQTRDVLRRAGPHDPAAAGATLGPEIDDPIGALDDFQVVLDDD